MVRLLKKRSKASRENSKKNYTEEERAKLEEDIEAHRNKCKELFED